MPLPNVKGTNSYMIQDSLSMDIKWQDSDLNQGKVSWLGRVLTNWTLQPTDWRSGKRVTLIAPTKPYPTQVKTCHVEHPLAERNGPAWTEQNPELVKQETDSRSGDMSSMLTAPVVNYPKPWTISSGANHWDLHVPMKIYGKQMTELSFGYTNGPIRYDDDYHLLAVDLHRNM